MMEARWNLEGFDFWVKKSKKQLQFSSQHFFYIGLVLCTDDDDDAENDDDYENNNNFYWVHLCYHG